eukprot:m.60740 g.60740  ORF g.60740 m.60740 type:complete len:580 (-) comp11834_c0_seq1:11463-13202(-)
MSAPSASTPGVELTNAILNAAGYDSVEALLGPLTVADKRELNPTIQIPQVGKKKLNSAASVPMPPIDEFNVKHVSHVHPPDYVNPKIEEECDLVVIGAGVAGLLSVIMGNALGKKCILIEKHYMGGDCLNIGCFPSKALLASAHAAHTVRSLAPTLGINVEPSAVSIDFPAIMQRMRRLRSDIAPIDSVERYKRDFCHEILLGHAAFTSPNTISIDGQTLTFKKAMIATGGSASVPPVPGLAETPHLTNNNFFDLEALPPSMLVIGSGPIGVEMAQALQRLGSDVTIVDMLDRVLPREDAAASAVLQESLEADGIKLLLKSKCAKVEIVEQGNLTTAPFHKYSVTIMTGETSQVVEVAAVLNATGRIPNVHGLGLEEAGVEFDSLQGVAVNGFYCTSNPNVYACGDVASPFKFTHSADWGARIAIRNMFLGDVQQHSSMLVPWCTYTDPEVAHVGKYESDLESKGIAFDTLLRELHHVDRCKCDGETKGFVKMFVRQGQDEILGATICGPNAGDMLSEITTCMQYGIGATKLAGVMHPYPTHQEAVRQCAAQANKMFKTPEQAATIEKLLQQQGAKSEQ